MLTPSNLHYLIVIQKKLLIFKLKKEEKKTSISSEYKWHSRKV